MYYHTFMDWVTLSYRDNNFCALQFTSLITPKGRGHGIHACTTLTLHYDKAIVSLWREQTHVERKLAEKENYMEGIDNQITNLSRMVCFVKIVAFCFDRECCVLNHWSFQIQHLYRWNQTVAFLLPSRDIWNWDEYS